MDACQRCLEHFHHEVEGEPDEEDVELIEACRWLQTLVSDMNRQLVDLVSVQQYDHELSYGLLPLIHNKFEALDEVSVDVLTDFFAEYRKRVQFNTAHKPRELLNNYHLSCSEQQPAGGGGGGGLPADLPMQEYALEWALQQPGIAHVVLGMTSEGQVDQALGVLERRRRRRRAGGGE